MRIEHGAFVVLMLTVAALACTGNIEVQGVEDLPRTSDACQIPSERWGKAAASGFKGTEIAEGVNLYNCCQHYIALAIDGEVDRLPKDRYCHRTYEEGFDPKRNMNPPLHWDERRPE